MVVKLAKRTQEANNAETESECDECLPVLAVCGILRSCVKEYENCTIEIDFMAIWFKGSTFDSVSAKGHFIDPRKWAVVQW